MVVTRNVNKILKNALKIKKNSLKNDFRELHE